MPECANIGCEKPARKRFCSNVCKDRWCTLRDKEKGIHGYAPKPPKRKAPKVIEAFKW